MAGCYSGNAWLFKIDTFENNRPAKPTHVYNENTFQLAVSSTDPDGDKIRYGVSWDNNGVVDMWTDYYNSGEEGSINCFGKDKPAYVIAEDEHGGQSEWVMAKAKDVFDVESDWATLEVSIPKNHAISTPLFSILENHPHMFPILRHLMIP